MFRLPCDLLDPDVVEGYCVGDQVSAWVTEEFVVLNFTSEDEAGDFDYDAEALLSAIVGVRAELATGDLRPLYLVWLAAYDAWERDENAFDRDADDDLEPPVPPGLGTLTAVQRALADFLRLDDDLLTIAAQTNPPLEQIADDPGELAAWVKRLPVVEKNRLLRQVVQGDAARIRTEMLRRFRGKTPRTSPILPRRTVANLLDDTARLRSDRGRRLAAQRGGGRAPREGPSAGPRTTTGRTRAQGNRRVVTRRRADRHPKTGRVRRHHHATHRTRGGPWSLRERLDERDIAELITAYRDGATAASLAFTHGVSLKTLKRIPHTAELHPPDKLPRQRWPRRIRASGLDKLPAGLPLLTWRF